MSRYINHCFRKLVLLLVSTSTIAGCYQPPEIAPQPTPMTGIITTPTSADSVQDWHTLLLGETFADLAFTQTGTLSYQGMILLDNIQVSGSSDGTATYAKRLKLSPTSPSGHYTIIKACEQVDSGLCWTVYKLDRTQKSIQKVSIGKYGGLDWVQWSSNDRYAVFLEKMEGTAWFVILDLQTGESKMSSELAAQPNLDSFSWTGDLAFTVSLSDQSQFQGDIATLFQF